MLSPDHPNYERINAVRAVYDDTLRDKAAQELTKARAATLRAVKALLEHAEAVDELFKAVPTKPPAEMISALECIGIAGELDLALDGVRRFHGAPEPATSAEWQAVLTDAARLLSAAKLPEEELAQLIYGDTNPETLRALKERCCRSRRRVYTSARAKPRLPGPSLLNRTSIQRTLH